MLQEIDLNTVKIEDLTFTVPYLINAVRNDYLDALVTYFTVEFTKCHKKTGITTGSVRHWYALTYSCTCSAQCLLHPLEADSVLP